MASVLFLSYQLLVPAAFFATFINFLLKMDGCQRAKVTSTEVHIDSEARNLSYVSHRSLVMICPATKLILPKHLLMSA